jgi:radical SAM superfamily enzyme YgiQ (UPF0313 family)
MAAHRVLLDGMVCASQTTRAPWSVLGRLLAPRLSGHGVRASLAPLGLRRVEAALLRDGFSAADVAVVSPERLHEAVGPNTVVVGVSTGDPLGRGMHSTTMAGFLGGRPWPAAAFQRLMRRLRRLRRFNRFRIVVGGPGAWQLAGDDLACADLGVDHVLCGYAEGWAADAFRRLAAGQDLPRRPAAENADTPVPPVRGATAMGAVEVSRGCGKGCRFCALSRVPMAHMPAETILADAQTNLAAGVRCMAAVGEDFFRYGAAQGAWANPKALLGLLSALRSLPTLGLIQIDHANVASVAEFSDADLHEARRLFVGDTGCRMPWLNLGVETVSGELLAAAGCVAKVRPHPIESWADLCREQVLRLVRAGFLPMVSLVMGLEGETPAHVAAAARWVRSLSVERVTVFPLFLAPMGNGRPFSLTDMRQEHWDLWRACYDLDCRWTPRWVWDNQRAGGVGLARRLFLRSLAIGHSAGWKALTAWRCRGASR